jgi:hypothetical protein
LLEQHRAVSVERQVTGRRERRRPGADEGDALAGGRLSIAREQIGIARERGLRRIALQAADLNRRAPPVVVDAITDAEDLDGADARARVAEEVLGEDRPRCPLDVVGRDLVDERRDVDPGRARLDARRVGAVDAPRRLRDASECP